MAAAGFQPALLALLINPDHPVTHRIMRPEMSADIRHARQLLDQLAPEQVAAVVHLMEVMLNPVSRALAIAPVDDVRYRRDACR